MFLLTAAARLCLLLRIVLIFSNYYHNLLQIELERNTTMSDSVDLVSSTNYMSFTAHLSAGGKRQPAQDPGNGLHTLTQRIGRLCICKSLPKEGETIETLLQCEGRIGTVLELARNHYERLDRIFDVHGYLLLLKKQKINRELVWVKRYCCYRMLSRMMVVIAFDTTTLELSSTKVYDVSYCTPRLIGPRKQPEYGFELTVDPNRYGSERALVFQAESDEDERLWLDAFGCCKVVRAHRYLNNEMTFLNNAGFIFIEKCLAELEFRGLMDRGLYRLSGVASKANGLIQYCLTVLNQGKKDAVDCAALNIGVAHTKTIASAIKVFFKSLPDPLLTYKYRETLMQAAEIEDVDRRYAEIEMRILNLPQPNYMMLKMMIIHLKKLATLSIVNQMTIPNIARAFGTTFFRFEVDKIEALTDVENCYRVMEILLKNADALFKGQNSHFYDEIELHPTPPLPETVLRSSFQRVENGDMGCACAFMSEGRYGLCPFTSAKHDSAGCSIQRSHVEREENGTSVWTWREHLPCCHVSHSAVARMRKNIYISM